MLLDFKVRFSARLADDVCRVYIIFPQQLDLMYSLVHGKLFIVTVFIKCITIKHNVSPATVDACLPL